MAMKNPKNIVLFPRGGHIFFQNVVFYSSLKSCNEWVSALEPGVLDVSSVLGYADSTSSKIRVSAHSRDWLIAE